MGSYSVPHVEPYGTKAAHVGQSNSGDCWQSQATLSFDWKARDRIDTSDTAVVEISDDPSDPNGWTVLKTFTGITGTATGWESFDITGFISDKTTVRFRITKYYGGSSEYFKIDNVKVVGICP